MLPPAFKGHGLHARNSRQLHAVRWKAPFRLRRWCTTVAVHLLLHARCQIRATVFPLSTGACTGLLPSRRSRPSCSNRRRSRNQTSATCCAFPPNLPSSHAGDAGLVSGTSTWFSRSLGGLEELYSSWSSSFQEFYSAVCAFGPRLWRGPRTPASRRG